MDPNAALEEIRSLISQQEHKEYMSDFDAERLVELVDALDEWIARGGFLPAAWTGRVA